MQTKGSKIMKKTNKPKSNRQAAFEAAYKKGKKDNITANEAASWATKKFGFKIAKADVQHWAMKNNLPYLDELQHGVRVIVTI